MVPAASSASTVFSSLKVHVVELESRLAELERTGAELDARLAKWSSAPPPQLLQAPGELYPTIGSLVQSHADARDADDADTGLRTSQLGVTEIDSLCMHCEGTGTTSLLLTKIPFFQEVILMSFACPHCGHRDTQIQSGGAVQDRGQRIAFKVQSLLDLSRQVVKSETATLRVEELDLDIPPSRGTITTLEGVLSEAREQLGGTQEARLARDGPEVAAQVDAFLARLDAALAGTLVPLTIRLDDPAGNSFIDNPSAPRPDPRLTYEWYARSAEQIAALGLQPEDVSAESTRHVKAGSSLKAMLDARATATVDVKQEMLHLPADCPECRAAGEADTCIVNLPFFKEVIIMSFNCERCGFRDTEIKGGGAITELGRRDTLQVLDPKVDLSRDVIKSDTAGVRIPELELGMDERLGGGLDPAWGGLLGGQAAAGNGLVTKMKDTLFENGMFQGDSSEPERAARFDALERQFEDCLQGRLSFTLIIEDPLANSYIYSPFAPAPDPRLLVETYTRSFEEDEDLGLHDMNVDHVDFIKNEVESAGQQVFSKLQKDQPSTHPNPYGHGGE